MRSCTKILSTANFEHQKKNFKLDRPFLDSSNAIFFSMINWASIIAFLIGISLPETLAGQGNKPVKIANIILVKALKTDSTLVSGYLLHIDNTTNLLMLQDDKDDSIVELWAEEIVHIAYSRRGSFGAGFGLTFLFSNILAVASEVNNPDPYFGRGFKVAYFNVVLIVPASIIVGSAALLSRISRYYYVNGNEEIFLKPYEKLSRSAKGLNVFIKVSERKKRRLERDANMVTINLIYQSYLDSKK